MTLPMIARETVMPCLRHVELLEWSQLSVSAKEALCMSNA
jgi:hypothetical protein